MSKLSLEVLLSAVGELRDDSRESERFRRTIERPEFRLEDYERWIDECLASTGPQYNNALQDVVNVLGKRLGFEVEYGRYKGKPGVIGFDGLWKSSMGQSMVIDTKTTSAYTIDPKQIVGYIKRLCEEKGLKEEDGFGLYVVGRFEPTTLEATIRGSGYQSKLRVITCRDLIELAKLMRDNSLDHSQIVSLMLPFDSINVGRLLQVIRDIISVQKEEIKEEAEIEEAEEEELWKKNGKKWHLERQLTTELSEALKSLIDFTSGWKDRPEISWNQKYYVGFRHPDIGPYWCLAVTTRASFLILRIRSKKGVFDEEDLRSRLGLPVEIDEKSSKKYDRINIQVRNKAEMEKEGLHTLLEDSFRAFKDLFLP